MRFLKDLFQNPIFTFLIGGAVFGSSILMLLEKKSEDNYYLAKSNLGMVQTLELNQKLLVIQDSILRLDSKLISTDEPSQKMRLMDERYELMDYYIKTAQELQYLLVGYNEKIDQKLLDHYYSKYRGFFEGKQWDKDQIFTETEGEPIIHK